MSKRGPREAQRSSKSDFVAILYAKGKSKVPTEFAPMSPGSDLGAKMGPGSSQGPPKIDFL